jgi:hypothetical protein
MSDTSQRPVTERQILIVGPYGVLLKIINIIHALE